MTELGLNEILYISGYLVLINGVTWLVYGWDKWKAARGGWRVPERNLILLAIIGGSAGALLAMVFFRHKTRHVKFTLGVPVIIIGQLSLFWWLYRAG